MKTGRNHRALRRAQLDGYWSLSYGISRRPLLLNAWQWTTRDLNGRDYFFHRFEAQDFLLLTQAQQIKDEYKQ